MIAIIAILAAILFPVFARAREKARQTNCLSNVKQIMTAWKMYAQDYDGQFTHHLFGTPGAATNYWWYYPLQAYIKNVQIFQCPSDPVAHNFQNDPMASCSYGMNWLYCNGRYTRSTSGVWVYPNPPSSALGYPVGGCEEFIWEPADTIAVTDCYGRDSAGNINVFVTDAQSGGGTTYAGYFANIADRHNDKKLTQHLARNSKATLFVIINIKK